LLGEDDERILGNAKFIQPGQDHADGGVEVFRHRRAEDGIVPLSLALDGCNTGFFWLFSRVALRA
jgi:hypothetical protein